MDYDALAERWSTFDSTANIYRVEPTIEPLDDVLELAGRAGLVVPSDQGWNEIGPLLEIEQQPQVLTVYRPSRAVQWIDRSRWQIDDGESSMDVSDDEAVAVVTNEVERLGLLDRDVFEPRKVTRLNVASAEKGRDPTDARVIDIGVVLARIVDGLPVEGPGGNIVVYLDSELQSTGFERVARRIADVHEPVRGWRSLADVLAETENYWRRRLDQGLEISDARLGYLEFGRLQEQEYIQPVYALSLTLTELDDGEVRTVEHYVPAAVNGVGPVMPTGSGPVSGRRG